MFSSSRTAPLSSRGRTIGSPLDAPTRIGGAGAGGAGFAATAARCAASPIPCSPLATIQSTSLQMPKSLLPDSPAGTRSIAASIPAADGSFGPSPWCTIVTRGVSPPLGYAPAAAVSATSIFRSAAKSTNESSRSPPAVHLTLATRGNADRHSSASSSVFSARLSAGTTRCSTAVTSPAHASGDVSLHARGAPATAAANAHPPAGVTPDDSASVTRPAPVPTSTTTRNSRPTRSVSSPPPTPVTFSSRHGATRLSTASSSPAARAASAAARTRAAAAARALAPPSAASTPSSAAARRASSSAAVARSRSASISPPRRCNRSTSAFAAASASRVLANRARRSANAESFPTRVRMRAAWRPATSADAARRRRRSTSCVSAACDVSAAISRDCAAARVVRSSAARAAASERATDSSAARRCLVNASLAASWHCFLSALPLRLSASWCAGFSDAARRSSGGCAASTSRRASSMPDADALSDSLRWSCMGSIASISGAVRHTRRKPSVSVSGGGALHNDSIARDFLRRFFASMKDTSHARKNVSRSTAPPSIASADRGGIPGHAARNARKSSAALAPRSCSRCAAPGVKSAGAATLAPKGERLVDSAPAPVAAPKPPKPEKPPAMVAVLFGVNAAPIAPPMGGSGDAAHDGRPGTIVRRTLSSAAWPCCLPLSFSIISSVSGPGVNPSSDSATL